jgi:hypothetical protein
VCVGTFADIAGEAFQEMPLTVENMKEDRALYDMLEEDLETVERFYLDQLLAAHKRFYQILQHCIKLVGHPSLFCTMLLVSLIC